MASTPECHRYHVRLRLSKCPSWRPSLPIHYNRTSSKQSRIDEYLATESLPDLTQEELSELEATVVGVHARFFVSHALLPSLYLQNADDDIEIVQLYG